MFSFAPQQLNEKILLANANALIDFTPQDISKNNSLDVDNNGKISVTSRGYIQPEWYQYLYQYLPIQLNTQEMFAQEKMIILWHLSQFMPYLEKRLKEIQGLPKKKLQDCYIFGMNVHGFYQLCDAMFSQITLFKGHIHQIEKAQANYLPMGLKLLQKQLDANWEQSLDKAKAFMNSLLKLRNSILPKKDIVQVRLLNGNILTVKDPFVVRDYFTIGKYQLADHKFSIEAFLDFYEDSDVLPLKNPFSEKIGIEIDEHELMLYPSWSYMPEKPRIESDFISPTETSTACLNAQYKKDKFATLALGAVKLCAYFSNIEVNADSESFSPYFMLMIQAAKLQGFDKVTLYGPVSLSNTAQMYGFDCKAQVLEEDKQKMIPFSFDMVDYTKRTINSGWGETTYAKLLQDSKIIDIEKYPDGIFPEFNKAPLPFTPSFKKTRLFEMLKNRENGKQFRIPNVTLSSQKIDYHLLANSEGLQSLACSDPVVTKESGYTTQLRLN